MHIKFHCKIEFELKFANSLDLSLEPVPQEPRDRASHISYDPPWLALYCSSGPNSGWQQGTPGISASLILFAQNYLLPPQLPWHFVQICYFALPLKSSYLTLCLSLFSPSLLSRFPLADCVLNRSVILRCASYVSNSVWWLSPCVKRQRLQYPDIWSDTRCCYEDIF